MALSDLEVGKAGGGKIIDAKSRQRPAAVGLNPWKLAHVRPQDAAGAAARARAKSSILLPTRPGTERLAANVDADSGFQSSSGSEIRLAVSRRGRRNRNPPGLPSETWSKTKQDRIGALSEDSEAIAPNPDSSLESLPPLPQEPRSPYRSSPSFPGQARPEGSITLLSSANSADVVRISVNSDGYEASCGESGDDTSDAVGLSESWDPAAWKKFSQNPATSAIKDENVKPWIATFNQEVTASPGGERSA